MKNEIENLSNINANKEYSIISNIDDLILENNSQSNDNLEKLMIKKFLSDVNNKNIAKKIKCLYILEILSKLKLSTKHNCTDENFHKYISNILIDNIDCHMVSIFKENMLTDYIDEFLRRLYKPKESKERIPKFSKYYKNYLMFFCKPTFRNFRINKIINKNGEKKAEIYYKNNYQGGKSQEDDENNGFAQSSSSDENKNSHKNKKENIESLKNLEQLFDESLKEKIENVTVMTSMNSSINNTINLKIDNEKIEVFSENKCDKSNDTTLHDIMDIIKKKKHRKNSMSRNEKTDMQKIKKDLIKSKEEKNNEIIKSIKNNENNSYKNIRKKSKNNDKKINININNILNAKYGSHFLLNQGYLNKNSKDKIRKIIKSNHININNNNNNKNLINKNYNENDLYINISPTSFTNHNNKNINNEININKPKNKSTSQNKKKSNKKIIINNNSSDILYKNNSNNNNKKKNKSKSRNKNIGFLYKETYTNDNNNINNLNKFNINKFNSTTLHKINKKINFNNKIYSSIKNIVPINNNNKLLNNFPISRNQDQKYFSNHKYYISNTSLENKGFSTKIFETYVRNSIDNKLKDKNLIKLTQTNKFEKLNNNCKTNNNYFNNYFIHRESSNNRSNNNNEIINSNNSKAKNKILGNNLSSTKCSHQDYNSLAKKLNNKVSSSNKKRNKSIDPTQIMTPLLYEGNSSLSYKTVNNNINNINNTNYSKNFSNSNNYLTNNNHKTYNSKESKKYLNYNNINNNYNININNQIIINANTNPNNFSYSTNLKEYVNSKIKNQDFGLLKLYKGKNYEKRNSTQDCFGVNNNNIKKNRTRNINSGLQKFYTNPNNNGNGSLTKNDFGYNKIIKSYHNKKLSGISNLMNDKKLLFLKKK